MGKEDGPNGGGTGQIGPNSSTDTTACQTPTQPDIPAWMVARNNSVHAPVFEQPSTRKSRKLLSTAVSVSKADTTQSPTVPSQARDMAIEPKVAPLPLNPSPSVELDGLDDDQALALLLKNETVAGLLQDAFNTRVLEYQQKLQRAYNQRLVELEYYTRSWRDTTKELWSALSEGTVKPNKDQRETLLWNGPQDAGLDFNPELPSGPQEIVEKEVDSDGRVACISIKPSGPSQSVSKVACQLWTKEDTQGRDSFSPLGPDFWSVTGVQQGQRLLFVTTDKYGIAEYRSFKGLHTIATDFSNKHDVFIELSPENVRILAKAFCYLNDRKNQCCPRSKPAADLTQGLGNARRFYNYFLAKPTPTHIRVLVLPISRKKRETALRRKLAQQTQKSQRLLIARPCYNKHGDIEAASFLDVGSDLPTSRRNNAEEVVLFEDKTALNRLAHALEFSISLAIFSDFKLPMVSSPDSKHSQEHSPQPLDIAWPSRGDELNAVKPNATKFEGCETSTSPEGSKPPPAWLFQRTIALSDGLKKLNGSTSHESPNFQHKHQGLAMGGEPKEVRSPSPTEQKAPVISRRLAHRGDTGIPPIGFANQENREIASDNGGSSDLIMLDGEPMGITAPQREKHSLSPFSQEDSTAKRIRFSATEGSAGYVEQLSPDVSHSSAHRILSVPGLEPPMQARAITQSHLDKLRADPKQSQCGLHHRSDNAYFRDVPENVLRQDGDIDFFEPNLHTFLARGSEEAPTTNESEHQVFPSPVILTQPLPPSIQDPIKSSNTVPLSSAITARELHKLRQQLRRLENHLQDNVDHIDEKTVDGEIEEIGRLQIDIKRFEGVLAAQREIEERQEVSENPRTKPDLSSPDVSHSPETSSNDFNPFSAEPKGATYGRDILMGQSESTPMDGIPPFSPVNDIPSIEASAAPELSTCTIPTQSKAVYGVPTEPRAMRMSMPTLRKPCWQQLSGPRAVSIGPSTQYPGSQVGPSSNSTLRGSLGTPNQVYAGNGCIHVDSTGLQSETDRQQPLGAMGSLPPPSCGDERR